LKSEDERQSPSEGNLTLYIILEQGAQVRVAACLLVLAVTVMVGTWPPQPHDPTQHRWEVAIIWPADPPFVSMAGFWYWGAAM